MALVSSTLPTEILQALLNLAEFMERHHKPLPIDYSLLSSLSLKCKAHAKALRY
jgi:FKBP12-rapamycin complex-associated protein